MISLRAAIARTAIGIYTYPYRKKFASLSRSVTLKNSPYVPPEGFTFAKEVHGGVQVEKLTPQGAVNGIILQFHGGGHTTPMNDMYRKAAERLAENCNCIVYSIDHRTDADLTYPSVHDECYSAYVELCKNVASNDVFVALGDSFGANLLLSTCLRAREDGVPLPSAIVCISSFIDMAASGDSYRANCYKDPLYALPKRYDFETHEKDIRRISPYCGNTPLTDPYLSPAYADLHGFPKTLILCGGSETSLSDSLMLYDGLAKRGCFAKLHVFQGMWHDFMYMLPRLKESKLAWQEIFDFITADLHPKAEAKCTEQNGTVTRVSRKRRR